MSYNPNSKYGLTEVFVKHDYYSKLRIKIVKKQDDKLILLKYTGDELQEVSEVQTTKKLYPVTKGFMQVETDDSYFYFYESGEHSIYRYKYIKHEGSSRSSKTYSLIEAAIRECEESPNERISVWRDTQTSLGDTVWNDIKQIYPLSGRSYKFPRNTTAIYFDNGATLEPHGADATNAHGFTQKIAWLNEPYKITKETFDQIDMRAEQIWIDLNPPNKHWSDSLNNHPRCKVIHSTFMQNPFCPIEMKLKILSYDPSNPVNVKNGTADAYMWSVYGLGQKAEKPHRIFKGWQKIKEKDFFDLPYTSYYATDFGLSAPTANIEFKFDGDRTFFVHQHLYKPLNEIPCSLSEMFEKLGHAKNKENIVDSSNELNKSEGTKLKNAGFNAIFAQKGHGSVNAGIETLQKCQVCYTDTSEDFEDEYYNYSWKVWRGIVMDEPDDNQNDHALDAFRMGVSWYVKTRYLKF